MTKTYAIGLAGLLLHTALAKAQNLVQNPDFSNGLTGWTIVSGAFVIDDVEGSPASPSLRATGAPPGGTVALVTSPCIQISAPVNVDFSSNVKPVSPSHAEVDLYGFTDTACANGWNVIAIVGPSQDGTWTTGSSTNIAIPAGVRSVIVQLYGFSSVSGGTIDVHFDHILFGPTGSAPVRLQSFDVD